MNTKHEVDVLVIGAGQAGLSMGYYLRQTKLSFLLVDSVDRIGHSWRNRYDSLVLFSPNAYSALPGMALQGDPEDFPHKDTIADYLECYAKSFALPVALETRIQTVTRMSDRYFAHTTQGPIAARYVVVATGAFSKPFVPGVRGKASSDVLQLHSSEYKRPSQLPEGPVLIAGAGNSGAQIAAELSEKKEVVLACGHNPVFVPVKLLGKSLFWWYDKLGILRLRVNTLVSRFSQQKEPIIGTELREMIRSGRVKLRKKLVAIHGRTAEFVDRSTMNIASIIWATGYQPDFRWIKIDDVIDVHGNAVHKCGVSTVPGLYFLGLPWLSGRRSAQLGGVGADAQFICQQLVTHDAFARC